MRSSTTFEKVQTANPQVPQQLEPAQREELKKDWARLQIIERKGIAAGLDKDRKTQIQIMLQQSRALASKYFKDQLESKTKRRIRKLTTISPNIRVRFQAGTR
jgi:uncharacterized protein YmfQ (DUF2313 family)